MISENVSTTFGEAPTFASRRTIPFDYAFRYVLTGNPGTVLNSTVTVSIEAAFVAVSIGYGVIPEVTPITFGPTLPQLLAGPTVPTVPTNRGRLRDITLSQVLDSLMFALDEDPSRIGPQTGTVLTNGVKINPAFAARAFGNNGNALLEEEILTSLFQVVGAPPEHIQFLYAIFDEGSGREFQSDPILNIAGLGISDGDRPFRYFARPITFDPRTTIRIEVREVSDFKGQLHVSLHGYKVLGGAGTPTGRIRQSMARSRRR
jgi:hypothetical protein